MGTCDPAVFLDEMPQGVLGRLGKVEIDHKMQFQR